MPERKTKREDELFIFAFEVCPAHYTMSDNLIARVKAIGASHCAGFWFRIAG